MTLLVVVALMIAAVLLWTSLGPGAGPRPGRGGKRCSRCWRSVDRLQPYIDGRREFWVCAMCASEMELVNASRLDIPRG